ncbi:YciI family protein [Microbacterium sp. NPDC058389]|uniref:YciI family protein n=1 Tax=Microbacterium sp. NPDC058389 TaxID=3346475 RepID=UPI0036524A6F
MAKYLMLKHYRGGRPAVNETPMEQLTPQEWAAHVQYMQDMERRLFDSGELLSSEALTMGGSWVRFDGEGRPPVVDGPFAETKDLIAGFMLLEVDSHERALELTSEMSAAPWAGGKPLGEWLELREVMSAVPTDVE